MTTLSASDLGRAQADSAADAVGTGLSFSLAQSAWGPPASSGDVSAQDALDRLRQSHRAEARAHLDRVHPSWLIRALQEESPSVKRVVAGLGPESIQATIREALGFTDQDLRTDHAPHPDVLTWVLALWTERLVGGEPARPDDPPAVIALSRLSVRQRHRLCHASGLAKLSLAGGGDGIPARTIDRQRFTWFHDRLGSPDPAVRSWADRDRQAATASPGNPYRHASMMGLTTLARLLVDCEPFRVRWALQHLTYVIVKRIRSLMRASHQEQGLDVSLWESRILRAAWERLNHEGRISLIYPHESMRERDVC